MDGWDVFTGCALLASGAVCGRRRAGLLLIVCGGCWFLGDVMGWAVFVHRGVLFFLVLTCPAVRPGSVGPSYEEGPRERKETLPATSEERPPTVTSASTSAGRLRTMAWKLGSRTHLTTRAPMLGPAVLACCTALYPLTRIDAVAVVEVAALVGGAALRLRTAAAGAHERRARGVSFAAAVLLGGAVLWGVVARRSDVAGDLVVLRTYELVVAVVGGGLCAAVLLLGSARAALTRLVVDLGEPDGGGPLRARLAPVLGDPRLELGYWVPELRGYVDEAGRPVQLPPTGAGRVVTPLGQDGRPLAVLVHDGSMPHDRALLSAVASVARLAVSNARLQAEIRGRLAELESSRRRLVEATDTERRRLERQLDEDVLHRLDRVAEVLAGSGDWAGPVLDGVRAAHAELREFARGIHPATLVRDGLAAALAEQIAQCPLPLTLDVPEGRFDPAVEAAAYFICCEALTNAVKHADAGRVSVRIAARPDGGVEVEVRDDGTGGARPELGTGLRGLADRAEALGGTLRVDDAPGGGTRLFARIPQGVALGAGARDSGADPDVREVADPYRRNRSEQSAGGE